MLKVVEPKINNDLIEALTHLLEQAKTGQITGMALAYDFHTGTDRSLRTMICTDGEVLNMVVHLECLKYRILDSTRQG